MNNRMVAGDRFSSEQILTEARNCMNTLLPASEYSAKQMVFGSNPADLYEWGGDDEGLLLAHGTSLAAQVAQKWQLRVMAQGAARKEMAIGKPRRLLA